MRPIRTGKGGLAVVAPWGRSREVDLDPFGVQSTRSKTKYHGVLCTVNSSGVGPINGNLQFSPNTAWGKGRIKRKYWSDRREKQFSENGIQTKRHSPVSRGLRLVTKLCDYRNAQRSRSLRQEWPRLVVTCFT